jgi:hypothetical protein
VDIWYIFPRFWYVVPRKNDEPSTGGGSTNKTGSTGLAVPANANVNANVCFGVTNSNARSGHFLHLFHSNTNNYNAN